MTQKTYQTKLSRQMLESLHSMIELLLATPATDDNDRLHFSVLAELKHRLYIKLDNVKKDYQLTLTPAQAIALRILHTDYLPDVKTYTGNKLHQISNEVHKLYQ